MMSKYPLRDSVPTFFVSKKIAEHERKIKDLEANMNMLIDLLNTHDVSNMDDYRKSILDGMTKGVMVSRRDISFPDHIKGRTQRKYMADLVLCGYVNSMGRGKGRRYIKVKDYEQK